MENTCQVCGTEIPAHRKYCCKKHANDGRRGKKYSKETCNKIRTALAGKPLTEIRKQRIGLANTKNVEPYWLDKLFQIWEQRYIVDYHIIKERTGFPYSHRVYNRTQKTYAQQFDLIKFLPTIVQRWPEQKMQQFLVDAKQLYSRELPSRYKLHKKTIVRLLKAFNLPWRKAPKRSGQETYPEKLVREFLEQNQIEFMQEFPLDNHFYDFKVRDILIEVHGDYWHCNPRIYDQPISRDQKINLINDAIKYQIAILHNYEIYYIWEYDLNRNLKQTLEKLRATIHARI